MFTTMARRRRDKVGALPPRLPLFRVDDEGDGGASLSIGKYLHEVGEAGLLFIRWTCRMESEITPCEPVLSRPRF